MKRAFGLIILAIGIMAGCTVKESAEFTEAHLVFTASRESVTPDTKSVKLDDGTVWWGPQEEISMFYGSGTAGGSKFTSTNTSHAETVEFEGNINISGSKEFWAVYPYSSDNSCDGSSITTVIPHQQAGVEGNFSNDAFPAMATASSMNLPFWNICGGVKFFVSRTDIKSVTIKGNNGETLAGKVKVAFNADGYPEVTEVIDGQTEVILTAPDGRCFKPLKYYYITLLPASLEGGITLTFTTDTEIGTLTSDKEQTIKRSIFGVLKNVDSKVQEWNTAIHEPDVVDLGLSVVWSTCNLGASAPEEYGNYYAYGETEPKSEYTRDNYITPSFPYYISSPISTRTVVYPLMNLPPEFDAASKALGGDWRMPTKYELEELINDCECSFTTVNGVDGYKLTSKINGNDIFFPSAGFKAKNGDVEEDAAGYACFYWSSSKDYGPYWLCLDDYTVSYEYHWFQGDRYYYAYIGQPVRPVKPNPNPRRVESISLDKSEVTLYEGRQVTLHATVKPKTAANKSLEWTSSNSNVLSDITSYSFYYDLGDDYEIGYATAINAGETTITVTTVDGGFQASCNVTVMPPQEMEAVDLGLSVKWASQNLGAFGPEEYEDYYECPGNRYYTGITELPAEDDPVRELLGDKWRLPTIAEWEELVDNCTWTWTTVHGVSGRTMTSKINGRSIFIPASGWRDRYSDLDMLEGCGSYGTYWSSTLKPMSSWGAYYLRFNTNSESFEYSRASDENWRSIRPVYGEFISVSSITLDKNSLDLMLGDSAQLNAAISPSNATAPSVYWESENQSIVSVDQNGNISAIAEGSTTITAFSSNGLTASCVVTIHPKYTCQVGEAIDLGLSVKWASFNVGATKPEEYGDYFAWGETEPKEDYSWSTYKWCNGEENKLTKYCSNSSYWDDSAPMDNKKTLDLEDDAAHVNWGGSWRMPTDEEWTALKKYCTWTWTSDYDGTGIAGIVVTASNGNSIFLPASGNRKDTNLNDVDSFGYYWSSFIRLDKQSCVWSVGFYSDFAGGNYSGTRCYGFSVRPVCPY